MSDAAAIMARLFRRAKGIGLSQDEMVRFSGLSPERLAELAKGAVPSVYEYERLCRAVAVDPSALYLGRDCDPAQTPTRFRTAFSIDRPSAADIRQLALAAEQGRILAHLLRLQGKDVPLENYRRFKPVSSRTATWQQGYELGERARRDLGTPEGPILDLGRLLGRLGVHVALVRFSSQDLDAACVWEQGAVAVILLNRASPRVEHPGARRSTLAHELCHLLHDAAKRDSLTTRVSWGAERVTSYSEQVEVRARAFAPAFLAPRSQVRAWYQGLPQGARNSDFDVVRLLAAQWGLSFEGAVWHAKNCQVISPEKAEELAKVSRPNIPYEQFEASSADVPPSRVHSSLPDRPTDLWEGWATETVLSALDAGYISVALANELLSWA